MTVKRYAREEKGHGVDQIGGFCKISSGEMGVLKGGVGEYHAKV